MHNDAHEELLDACQAVLVLCRRLLRVAVADHDAAACLTLQSHMDQLATAVQHARRSGRQSPGDPGE